MLKLRALEIVLILFYMEDLKQHVIQSIQKTDTLCGLGDRLSDGKPTNKESKDGKKLELARGVLVSEGVIDQAESDEFKDLVDYRNIIGHRVQNLTADVGAYSALRLNPVIAYDCMAAERAAALRQKVTSGMMSKFVMPLRANGLAFEAAERTYLIEIKRLKAKIDKGILQLNQLIDDANLTIRNIPKSVLESAQPGRPQHQKANGNLTESGKSCIFQLFDAKATPYAVAHMMRISLRAANVWFKRWRAKSAVGPIASPPQANGSRGRSQRQGRSTGNARRHGSIPR